MAALSVHTKLALGPRRSRPSLAPGPPISCGPGVPARRGQPGGLGLSALRFASPPSRQPRKRAGGCFATLWRRLQVALSVLRQEKCQGLPAPGDAGRARGSTPGCATLCPGVLLPRPLCAAPPSRPCRSTLPAAASLSRGHGCGDRAPRHNWSEFWLGGPHPSAHPLSRAGPAAPRCPAGFSLELEEPCLGWAAPVPAAAPPRTIPRRGVDLANFCGAGPPPRASSPRPQQCALCCARKPRHRRGGSGRAGGTSPAARGLRRWGRYAEFGVLSLILVRGF